MIIIFLIEWIAYHYHVVKLRHLIITMDPKSTTSPIKILERWSNKNYMTIEFWDESRYFDSSTHHNLTGVEVHRQRQKEFNVECLRSLKTQKKSWVLVTDSDEFVTINPLLLQEQERPLDPKYRIEQPNSVHTFLQRILIPTPELNIYTPCIPIHRRQYSAKEETTTTTPVVDDDAVFNPIHFLTLRWNYWGSNKIDFPIATGKTCPLQYKAGPTKVIIDLSRLRLQDLYHPAIEGNPHKPIESLCSQYDMYNVADQTGLIIHHYVGTQEQWDYRRNDHRGVGYRMARYQAIHDHVGIHTNQNDYDTIQSWLKGFIQNVGTNEAILLLDEVGKIDPPGTTTTTTTVVATTKQTTTYQVGDLVQAVFDINTAAIELEWYWVQITKTNVLQNATYYNVVFQYDCFEKLGVPAEEIRKNGTTVDTDLLRVNLTEYNPKNQN